MKYVILGILSFFLLNCKNVETEKPSAELIINTAIKHSGGDKITSSIIDFDFRDKHYSAIRNDGRFLLNRLTVTANKDSIFDVLTNDGFERFTGNMTPVIVEDSMKVKYSASVNSVHYFSILPYGLNDKAVNKSLLNDVEINGQTYHTVKVTFNQDGGGEDYEDVFLYWIDTKTFELDYLAYSYAEDDGIGVRFREAYNERYINEVRFIDYNNYKPIDATVPLSELPKLFENGQLKLLSKIELMNVTVN
ncbi:DUF6503 family protein [Psychroserpens ponticola]|uniref:Deoxyribose-phosphate aldolase n=1 Tax=Psychroserpens ponticola TaxID=2932268 RepID=A0ABY7RTR4_9FLAO|nr:DUF6503 family protein [Psychroserpens ponticola]WCO00491.1 deoxyribose-phosphate aldolase [Psychroserpens ponticola]